MPQPWPLGSDPWYVAGASITRESGLRAVPPSVVDLANAKSRRLRELLLAPEILVMPGAYDVLSAQEANQ